MEGREFHVRPAGDGDFGPLGIVGPAAYAAAYAHIWPRAADLAQHLESFGEQALWAFCDRPGASIWVAEQAGAPVGFLTLLVGSCDPIEHRPGGAEIARIFLLPNACGGGVGRRLFDAACAASRQAGCTYVWLDAMDTALHALAAYRSWGMTEIGRTRFPKPVAPEYAGMVVFRLDLI